jgi:hypothetical protein
LSIPYRIALEIPGEPREAPATFTDFDQGIAACVAYARQNPGVEVRMFVLVSETKLIEHHYPVFEVKVSTLDPFMRAGIRRQYGDVPPI